MVTQGSMITLSISKIVASLQTRFKFHINVDGSTIASDKVLSSSDSQAVLEISHSFNALFEQACRPKKDSDAQRAVGMQLFDLWLASSWEKVKASVPVGAQRFLVIASDVPDILNLPWELLLPPEGEFLGINSLFNIRRHPHSGKQLALFTGELRPRPLRLLFMACSPTDMPIMDYEREEEAMFRVISGKEVAFDSCDLGTFEELKERITEFKPHVVHLTGHGAVKDGQGHFAFEKEDGTSDLVPAQVLRQFLAGSGVQCVFVSGCQSGKAPLQALGGICQTLVSTEVPLALGLAASIADDLATNFARTFYRALINAQTVDRALLLARQEAWKACQDRDDPLWTLPVLYAATNQGLIFDSDPQRPLELPARPTIIQNPLPGMNEGYAEHFVDRRREQQRLLPALLSGKMNILILTGLGGSGKSALATHFARKLEPKGFRIIPVSSSADYPLNAARLLMVCSDAFLLTAAEYRAEGKVAAAGELEAAYQILNKPEMTIKVRLQYIVNTLNRHRFLLILDGLDCNLDVKDRSIMDPELSEFYRFLLANLAGNSRAIVTTRYLPSDVSIFPPRVKIENLSEFTEDSFLKILLHDHELEMRYRSGELPIELLRDIYLKFGGMPRFLLQMRETLKQMGLDELKSELEKVELPSGAERSELQKIRESVFDGIFTSLPYSNLSVESQRALSKSSVYGVAISMEGLMAVTGESDDKLAVFLKEWQNWAFVYPEKEKGSEELWKVYGLLRHWLVSRLREQEIKAAHEVAGDFLYKLEQEGKAGSLGLDWVYCLQEARSQYLQAKEYEKARKVTNRVTTFFASQGLYEEVRRLNLELLRYEEHPSQMIWIAKSYLDQGNFVDARKWYQLVLKDSTNLTKESADALAGQASIDLNQGRYGEAETKLRRALVICEQTGYRSGKANVLHQMAMIDVELGKYQDAKDKFLKALEIRQQIMDLVGEAATWHQLAMIDLKLGSYQEAKDKFLKAMDIRCQIGDKVGEASTWHQLAMIDITLLDFRGAIDKLQKALEISTKIRDKRGVANAWYQLATIDLREGKYSEAKEKFIRSLEIRQLLNDRYGEASTWHQLATIDLRVGKYSEAKEKFIRSLEIRQLLNDRYGEASTWHQLATIDLRVGKYSEAKEKFIRSLKIRQLLEDKYGEAATFLQLGILAKKKGKLLGGMRLVALCYLIDKSIGHGDEKSDFRTLSEMSSELGYSQEQLEAMMREVEESYESDRGIALIKAAFEEFQAEV